MSDETTKQPREDFQQQLDEVQGQLLALVLSVRALAITHPRRACRALSACSWRGLLGRLPLRTSPRRLWRAQFRNDTALFLGETEGILGVTAYGFILGQPTVDLILPRHVDVVAAEDEIAQETQWLLAHRKNRVLKLFPCDFELLELVSASLHEQQILEQIHRVQADASIVDGLKYLEGLCDILRLNPDQLDPVGQIAIEGPRCIGTLAEFTQQEAAGHLVAAGATALHGCGGRERILCMYVNALTEHVTTADFWDKLKQQNAGELEQLTRLERGEAGASLAFGPCDRTMTTENALFNEQRTAESAAYLLYRAGGRLPRIKLMKLLYLAERLSLQRYGEPITGDKLVAMPNGPVLSMTLDLINDARPSALGGWEGWIADRENHMLALADPSMIRTPEQDLRALSESDIEILTETWEKFGHFERWALVEYTHSDACPEWQDPEGSSRAISYMDVFEAVGYTAQAAQILADKLDAQQKINAAFNPC